MTQQDLPPESENRMDGLQRAGDKRPYKNHAIYTRFVQSMRIVLPLAAITVIMLLILWPQFDSQYISKNPIDIENRPDLKKELKTNKLLAARYANVDSNGRPYSVNADEAAQKPNDPDTILLTSPNADLMLDDVMALNVRSTSGIYHQIDQELALSGDVIFTRSDGTTLKTEEIQGNLKENIGFTKTPVLIEGPSGTLQAQSMHVQDNGMRILFKGPAKMQIFSQDNIVPRTKVTPPAPTPAPALQNNDEESSPLPPQQDLNPSEPQTKSFKNTNEDRLKNHQRDQLKKTLK